MSALTNFIPLAVISASIIGSPHCVGMCGGLSLSRSKTMHDQVLYHGGRLAGYMALGALAGAIGQWVFSPIVSVWASWVASVAMAVTFLVLGIKAWKGKTPHFSFVPKSWFGRVFSKADSFSLGLLTAVLPCGWLQTFVLSAVATKSALHGGLLLACFWIGTLPALATLPYLTKTVFKPLSRGRNSHIAAVLLVLAGFGSLAMRVYHAPFHMNEKVGAPVETCH